MTFLPPPGPLVSTGHIRVDAARAIAKLREYQLADPTSWVLEAIRAAVASRARSIEIAGDSNDLWVRWESEPWPTEVLPRLFDALVSPEPESDGQHLRLLGTAVNSALGLSPAYIDVIAIGGDTAARVRFKPEVLELPESDDATPHLREVAAVEIKRPPGPPGMLVHLRRRIGLDTLAYFLGTPPELARARDACAGIRVPVRVEGELLAKSDLVRVELGDGLQGYLALVDPAVAQRSAVMEVAEHGVVLGRYPLRLGIETSEMPVPIPVRLFIDAPRMPTNASRSDVRQDAHPIAAARTRGIERFPELVHALARELADPATPSDKRDALRSAALALVGASVAGPGWQARLRDKLGPLDPLLALPLVRNAVGADRALADPWNEHVVHTGDRAFPAELAPWLGDVLWVPLHDSARWLLVGAPVSRARARQFARTARRAHHARAKFLGHGKREARVTADGVIARATIEAGTLRGEVGILDKGYDGSVTVLYEGRPIAKLDLSSVIPFVAVVDTSEVTPLPTYDGIVLDDRARRIEPLVRAALIRAIEDFARQDLEIDGELFRRAFVYCEVATESPLVDKRCWLTVAGERMSLRELAQQRVIGTCPMDMSFDAPAGRIVIRVPEDQRRALAERLEPAVAVVRYDPDRFRLRAGDTASHIALALVEDHDNAAALAIREPSAGIRGAVVWRSNPGPGTTLRVFHAGVELDQAKRTLPPQLVDCEIGIDSDAVVPSPSWGTARELGGVDQKDFHPWIHAMAIAVARKLAGESVPDLIAGRTIRIEAGAGRALCEYLKVGVMPAELLGPELFALLRVAPLFLVGGGGRMSPIALAARYPDRIPWLQVMPEDAGDLQPLIGDEVVAATAGLLAGRVFYDATDDVAKLRVAAIRDRKRDALRARPPTPLALPEASHQMAIERANGKGVVGVGMRRAIEIEVRIEGRSYRQIVNDPDLPLIAAIDITEQLADETLMTEHVAPLAQLFNDVRATSHALLAKIAKQQPTALADEEHVRRLLAAWLDHVKTGGSFSRIVVRQAVAFSTVQHGRASIEQASRDGVVYIASWIGGWVGGDPDPLDAPILYCPGGKIGDELRAIFAGLATRVVEDVTLAVSKLQSVRRVTQGLLPPPMVVGADRNFTRKLEGAHAKAVGPGEIALVDETESQAILHELGVSCDHIDLDVVPPIRMAIEAPDLVSERRLVGSLGSEASERLTKVAQEAAIDLVRSIVKSGAVLPRWAIRSLRNATLAGRLDPALIADIPLFETTAGERVTWGMLVDQQKRFGDIWATNEQSQAIALDDARIVVRFERSELVFGGKLKLVDATHELELDAIARMKRALPRVQLLELDRDQKSAALTTIPLDGDGVSGACGVVAVLAPMQHRLRGIHVHRDMHPLGTLPDPCEWPTLALIDDARLLPDRTWSAPQEDALWEGAKRRISEASEAALEAITPAPADALATSAITKRSHLPLDSGITVRGVMWISGPPLDGHIDLILQRSMHVNVDVPVPVHGILLLFVHGAALDLNIAGTIAKLLYPELLAVAARADTNLEVDPDPRLVEHARFAIANDLIEASRLGRTGKLVRQKLAPAPRREQPIQPVMRPANRFADPPKPPPPPHPLRALADALYQALIALEVSHSVLDHITIEACRTPLVSYEAGTLVLAGDSDVLHAIEAKRLAGYPRAIDPLIAHVVTVLNVGLTEVTDAMEVHAISQLLQQALEKTAVA